jgi:DNA-binding transcriptional MerR regulator
MTVEKAPDAFRTISEVADELDVPQHVLRFWESRFPQIKPMKRGGGRRYYRPDDIDLLRGIRHLLYGEGFTIRGVQRILREQGQRFVQAVWREGAPQPPLGPGPGEEGDRSLFGLWPAAGAHEDGEEAAEREQGGDHVPHVPLAAAGAKPDQTQALAAEQLERLRNTLGELLECRKLLAAALGEGG